MSVLTHIEINNISKLYRKATTESLSNVSFSINVGQTIGVLGPNGAGKTTLISILCGLIDSSSGYVSYSSQKGNDISGVDLKKIIGFVQSRRNTLLVSRAHSRFVATGEKRIHENKY